MSSMTWSLFFAEGRLVAVNGELNIIILYSRGREPNESGPRCLRPLMRGGGAKGSRYLKTCARPIGRNAKMDVVDYIQMDDCAHASVANRARGPALNENVIRRNIARISRNSLVWSMQCTGESEGGPCNAWVKLGARLHVRGYYQIWILVPNFGAKGAQKNVGGGVLTWGRWVDWEVVLTAEQGGCWRRAEKGRDRGAMRAVQAAGLYEGG
ncbi:hypothetical protein B0H11DRAFT_2195418 [Mycena galericulata]|nr:hypothetical protein B0H11DRAFT_2195418 [Mycena galericulata]